MTYLADGNITQALSWVMTDYIGFGILYMFMGLVIFAVTYTKTENYGISGIIFVVYSIIVSSTLPSEIAMYFYLIIACLLAILLAKIYFGR